MTQEELIELILTLDNGQVLVVEAEAGSGKTHTVMAALAKLSDNVGVAVAAPTHIAKEELEDKLGNDTVCEVEFTTSCSLAGRYLHHNKDTGELENRFAPSSISYDLIVMDEVAATPACDVARVLAGDSPVVMLGDRAQLDAVKSRVQAIWTDDWQTYEHRSFTYVSLEGQWRSSGPLHDFQYSARDKAPNWLRSFVGGRMFYTVAEFEHDFMLELAKAYNSGGDISQYCMIAYRNSTVNRLQAELRQKVFGQQTSDGFAVGETVRCEKVTKVPVGRLAKVIDNAGRASTVVAGVTVLTCEVTLTMAKGPDITVKAVHPDFLDQYRAILDQLSDARDWQKYFELSNHFPVLVNANVMTAHKGQGRSIKYVWAHVDDLGSRKKLVYAAYSRASKTLTGVWPTEKHGMPKKYFAGLTLDQLNAERGTLLS